MKITIEDISEYDLVRAFYKTNNPLIFSERLKEFKKGESKIKAELVKLLSKQKYRHSLLLKEDDSLTREKYLDMSRCLLEDLKTIIESE